MDTPARIRIAAAALATAVLAACAPGSTDPVADPAAAADYPQQDITLTVVYPAGSAPDSTARALAGELEETLGTEVVVVNAEGGNGMVGLAQIVGEPADGYHIGFTASPPLTTSWQLIESSFRGPDSIQALAQTNEVPSVLFVNPQSGITTIEQFVAAAKQRPLKVGVPGAASVQRFQLEEFLDAAGITVEQVITDAGQQVLPAVNGTLDAAIAQPAPILQYVEKGDLAMIGYFGDSPPEDLDVTPFAEAGYDVTWGGFEGFIAPKGVPEPILDRLDAAIEEAVNSEAFTEYTATTYGVPAYLDRTASQERMVNDAQIAKETIARLGLGT